MPLLREILVSALYVVELLTTSLIKILDFSITKL
jgi:hypothetical protein